MMYILTEQFNIQTMEIYGHIIDIGEMEDLELVINLQKQMHG